MQLIFYRCFHDVPIPKDRDAQIRFGNIQEKLPTAAGKKLLPVCSPGGERRINGAAKENN